MKVKNLLFVLLIATPWFTLFPQKVFINGVRIYSLQNIELKNVTVKFDAQGNILIIAPNYEIKTQTPPPQNTQNVQNPTDANTPTTTTTTTVNTNATQTTNVQVTTPQASPVNFATNYFIYTEGGKTGTVPFEFEITVNNQRLQKITTKDSGIAIDITRYLKKGVNTIKIKAIHLDNIPQSNAISDKFKIKLISGKLVNGALTPDATLLQFVKSNSDIESVIKEFEFIVQ